MENQSSARLEDESLGEDHAHAALKAAVLAVLSGEQLGSSMRNGHSKHNLPQTVSFSQIGALHAAARNGFVCDFVGGVGKTLHFAARKVQPSQAVAVTKKRAREEDVETIVNASLVALKQRISIENVNRVHSILVRLHRDLRGSQGEPVVQNVGVQMRKLSPSDESARVVVFARLHSGIAIPVARLRSVLGEAWTDGVLSIESSVMGVGDGELALTPEAKASRDLGNLPLLMVFSLVPSPEA